jgi:hypothetical protein
MNRFLHLVLLWVLFFGMTGCAGKLVKLDPTTAEEMATSREGMAGVRIKDRWGFVNMKGKLVIPAEFSAVRYFSEEMAAVRVNQKWGYVNSQGKVTILPHFEEAREFSEGLAPVKHENRWGYIDPKGAIRIEYQFDDAFSFSRGLAAVKVGEKWGFIDKKGRFRINPVYAMAGDFKMGLAPVKTDRNDDPWEFIDTAGKKIIDPQFDDAGDFNSGTRLAPVQVDSEWGYIDPHGKIQINPRFDKARPFSNGLAAVRVGDKWGYINHSGDLVIPASYASAEDFFDQIALVSDGTRAFFIDPKGRAIEGLSATLHTQVGDKLRISRVGAEEPKFKIYLGAKDASRRTVSVVIINYSSDDLKIVRNTTENHGLDPRTIKAWETYTDYDLRSNPDGDVFFDFVKRESHTFNLWFWYNRSAMSSVVAFDSHSGCWPAGPGKWYKGRYESDYVNRTKYTRSSMVFVGLYYTITLYSPDSQTLVLAVYDTEPGYDFIQRALDYSHTLN